MIWLSLLLLTSPGEWHLDGSLFSNHGCWEISVLDVDAAEGSLVVTDQEHSVWVLTPNQEPREITLNDIEIGRVAIDQQSIFVTGVLESPREVLRAFDRENNGALLAERALPAAKNMIIDDDRLIVTTLVEANNPMILVLDRESLETRARLFKPTEALRRTPDFAALHVVSRNGVYAIASEVSNKIYFATPERRRLDGDRSDGLPNSFPFIELPMGPEYIAPVRRPHQALGLRRQIEGVIEAYQDWFSYTRVLYFGELGDRYVACYEIPDRVGGELLIGNHLGIQLFDKSFQPVGPVWERFGQIAGVTKGELVILYPDGREPLPGEPGAIEAHYGFDEVRDQQQLYDAFLRYRAPEEKSHHILVERFVPDVQTVVE